MINIRLLSDCPSYRFLVILAVSALPLLAACESGPAKKTGGQKPDGRIPLTELADKQAAMEAADRVKAQEKAREFTPEAMVNVADNLRRSGNYVAALQVYQQARDRDPENVGALMGQGEVFLAVGAGEEAERRFRAAVEILGKKDGAQKTPAYGLAAAGVARALTRQNKAEAALPFFDQAIAAGAANGEFFNYYGVTLDLIGRHGDAQVQYGKGLDLKPEDAALTNNLALSFALSENYETAVRLLSTVVTAHPEAAAAKKNLALVYGLSGDMKAAEGLATANQKPAEAQAQIAYIRQIAALPPDMRAKAIFIGLDKAPPPALPPAPPKMPDAAPPAPAADSAADTPPQSPAVVDMGGPSTATPKPAIQKPLPTKPAVQPPLPKSSTVALQVGSYPSVAEATRGWAKNRKAAPDLLTGEGIGEPYYWEADGVVRVLLPVAEGWGRAKTLCESLTAKGLGCLARRMPEVAAAPAPSSVKAPAKLTIAPK